jgi:BMFP domain-containing protein YqiC
MVQTTNRFFDEVGRLMNDAAGVAQGVRREFETLFRTQAERFLRDMDLVKREDFEAVKDMARIAREENETLKTRLAALEAEVAKMGMTMGTAMGAAASQPNPPPPAYGNAPTGEMHGGTPQGGFMPPNPDQPTGSGSF